MNKLKELKRKDEKMMSFVGIMKSHFGLVAFGDSKSSCFDVAGHPYEDKNREVKKVFKSNDFLLVSYGTNTVVRDNKEMYLEDLITSLFEDSKNFECFIKELNRELVQSYYYGKEYHFIYGLKNDNNYIINTIDMKKDETIYGHYLSNSCIFCKTLMTVESMTINCNWSIEKMESAAKIWCKSVIEMGNTFLEYNPVGEPIVIESLS